VNSVDPGAMNTDMRHAAYPDEDRTKLKTPSQMTDVFVFLASDDSRGISGQCFEAQEFMKTHQG
jgi:NAD(P)-dependent dehydrogenase (short-subunit alcohol dehydrogenase family)